jgi:hypothetical protein
MSRDLAVIEREAYRAFNRDGIIDLLLGLSLVWIGVAWLWLPSIAAFAGLLPAVLAPPIVMWRKDFVAERAGHVRWAAQRRRRERGGLMAALALGALVFVAAVVSYVAIDEGSLSEALEWATPGLLAWLLALLAVVLAVVVDAPRMLGYGAILAVAGTVAAVFDLSPGWPLLVAGLVVTASGVWLVVHFARSAAAISDEDPDLYR